MSCTSSPPPLRSCPQPMPLCPHHPASSHMAGTTSGRSPDAPGYWPSGSAFNALAPKPGPGRCGPADDARSTVICRVCPAVLAGPETANRLDARPVTPAAKQEQSTFCVPPPVAPRSEVPDLSALFRQFERIAAPRTSVANLSKISVITP